MAQAAMGKMGDPGLAPRFFGSWLMIWVTSAAPSGGTGGGEMMDSKGEGKTRPDLGAGVGWAVDAGAGAGGVGLGLESGAGRASRGGFVVGAAGREFGDFAVRPSRRSARARRRSLRSRVVS